MLIEKKIFKRNFTATDLLLLQPDKDAALDPNGRPVEVESWVKITIWGQLCKQNC